MADNKDKQYEHIRMHIKEIVLDNSGGLKMMELIPELLARVYSSYTPSDIHITADLIEELIRDTPELGILAYQMPHMGRVKLFVYWRLES